MKKLVILTSIFVLVGCVNDNSTEKAQFAKAEQDAQIRAKTEEFIQEVSSEKSIVNTFKILKALSEETDDHNIDYCKDGTNGYGSMCGICRETHAVSSTPALQYTIFRNITNEQNVKYLKEHPRYALLKEYFIDDILSTKDKVMLQTCVEIYTDGGWDWVYSPNCKNFKEGFWNKNECLFDYKKYLPDGLQIKSYKNLLVLYSAYKSSIDECYKKITHTDEFVCDVNSNRTRNCYEKKKELSPELKKQCDLMVEEKLIKVIKGGNF